MPPNLNGTGPSRLLHHQSSGFINMHSGSPQFKQSPFYSILEPLTPVLECKGETSRRIDSWFHIQVFDGRD